MKKKLLAGALIAVCLSLVAYGTTAYFTAEDTAKNIVTAGNIEISLHESIPPEDAVGIMPGAEMQQIVQVENNGENPAYVRVRVDKVIRLANDQADQVDLSLIGMDINTKDWTEKDGYYYYKNALNAGEMTKPLFTKIYFSKDMGDLYQNSNAEINVYVAAVQSENNGTNVMAATGWPAE